MSSNTCGITPGTVRAGCLTDDSSTDGTVKAALPAVFLFTIFFAIALLLPSSAFAFDGSEPTTTWGITPTEVPFPLDRAGGCPDSEDMQLRDLYDNGFPTGTFYYPNESDPIIKFTSPSEMGGSPANSFDFETYGVEISVFWVKSSNYLRYDYYGDLGTHVTYDTTLHTGVNRQGDYQGVSHLDICYREIKIVPLSVSKDAAGTYDRTVTWKLDKSVDDDEHSGLAGEVAGTSNWKVVADKTEVLDNYKVTGKITISNSNEFPVDFTVEDVLDTGEKATVICPAYTVPAAADTLPGTVVCTYSATTADKLATLNTVTVTASYEGKDLSDTGEAKVTWTEKLIGYDSGILSDNNEYNPNPDTVINGDTTWTYSQEFTCPSDASKYIDGSYTLSVPNTAKLNGNINLEDSEYVTVKCTLPALTVKKTAAGTYDRKVTWTLDKSVDDDSHEGKAGEVAGTSNWKVVADKTEVSSNFKVTGEITITNPAPISQGFTVKDVLNDDTVASVNCPALTVAAKGSVKCTYTAKPADASATENKATVSATGNKDQSDTASISWNENLTGFDSGTLSDDNKYNPYPSTTISDDTTWTYGQTFRCPSDTSLYVKGTYSFEVPNTAKLNGNLNLSDTEKVTVTCYLDPLKVSKTAKGTYDRTVTWKLLKSVTPTSHDGFINTTAGSSTWRVVATKSEKSDNYKVEGIITIENTTAVAQTFSVSDKLDDGTVAVVTCPTKTVAAKSKVECSYTAQPADDKATLNTATVSADGNPDQTGTAGVSFTENLIGDDEVTLDDDRETTQFPIKISATTTVKYGEIFKCSSNQADYTNGVDKDNYPNTATLTGENTNLSSKASVDVTCYAPLIRKDASASYDERHDWGVKKTVDPTYQDGLYPGDKPSWTWTIDVFETVKDQNFSVTGKIYVANPAGSPGPMTVALSDVLNDTTVATVDCGSGATSVIVAPGNTESCSYKASPTDASATLNKATGTFSGVNFVATAPVSFVKNVVNGTAKLSDGEIGLLNKGVNGGDQETATDTGLCPLNRDDYDENGYYTVTKTNTAVLKDKEGTEYKSTATTKYVCEDSTIDVLKLTEGKVDPSYDWMFALYVGPDGFGGTQVGKTSSTKDDIDGILDFGDPIPALRHDTTYTVCELGSSVAWAAEWKIDTDGDQIADTVIMPYNPNADDPDPEDLGNRCFDVGVGTLYLLSAGLNLRFQVDNRFPDGGTRTPGYWKNWNACSNGNQYSKTTDDVDPNNEFWSLEEALAVTSGITIGDLPIYDCDTAVTILNKSSLDVDKKGKPTKTANDAAYNLATALLAAQLNINAGVFKCQDVLDTAAKAQQLLFDIGFDGTGNYLTPKDKNKQSQREYALELMDILDAYNNDAFAVCVF